MSNAINTGVGLINTARAMLSRPGDAISMSMHGSNAQNSRLSVLNDKRTLLRREVSGDLLNASSGKSSATVRRNRFSFITATTDDEAAVLRSDMGMFAHTMPATDDNNSVNSQEDGHTKATVATEFVIYTAIIKQDRNLDLVTILTTERVIVTEYHRRPNSAYLKEQWVSSLENLQVNYCLCTAVCDSLPCTELLTCILWINYQIHNVSARLCKIRSKLIHALLIICVAYTVLCRCQYSSAVAARPRCFSAPPPLVCPILPLQPERPTQMRSLADKVCPNSTVTLQWAVWTTPSTQRCRR